MRIVLNLGDATLTQVSFLIDELPHYAKMLVYVWCNYGNHGDL